MDDELGLAALDAAPNAIFVVDADLRIVHLNAAARRMTGGLETGETLLRRGGELLHCRHSIETLGGCGASASCGKCIIRGSVTKCLQTGTLVRGKTRFQSHVKGEAEAFFIVTAKGFRHQGKDLVLLILDDLGELLRMRSILPICAHCRRIRTEGNTWEAPERYLSTNLSVDWSHGICDECLEKYHPV